MPAFFIAQVTVSDPEKFRIYAGEIGATMEPHGGEQVLRGQKATDLTGESDHQMAAVFRFPDLASIRAWYGSDAYQALIPVREAAAEMTITAYEVPD